MHGRDWELTGEDLAAGRVRVGWAAGRQHAGGLARSARSRPAQVAAGSQEGLRVSLRRGV